MLFKKDGLYGHVIEDSENGPVYADDRTPVDKDNPRPCAGCGVRIQAGCHDPCIAQLPGTFQACCGHGLECSPNSGRPAGYVGLTDGRTIEFSGRLGGERIRLAVAAALAGEALPEGFGFGQSMWWEGLTDAQRNFVWQRIPQKLVELVRLARPVEGTSPAFLAGEKPWWDGLDEEQKAFVLGKLPAAIAELVQEALTTSESPQ